MRTAYSVILVAGLILSATPTFAAPQRVENRCWWQANRFLPALRAREREAFIAKCIARYTAGSPPSRKSTDGDEDSGRTGCRCTELSCCDDD